MDNEILKHPDCPFDVIVRDDNALLRYKKTQSTEPANPQIVLMALLIKELTKPIEGITGTLDFVNPTTISMGAGVVDPLAETPADETNPTDVNPVEKVIPPTTTKTLK